MSLPAGFRLGPYEVLSSVGAGGMGEVYRARDIRLSRSVAVKVLPTAFASDQDRLRRFEQEARAAAALTHPNILAVHDVGTQASEPAAPIVYIVTELLEGETLRERLDAGPISPARVVDYATQLANGLAAAHDRHIVHRDLKPENIFVTGDGVVKILDFGLAKLAGPAAGASIATATVHTEAGVVLGTVGYMSPEQVRGEPADHRSDIFALGATLYEMATGHRAFDRETAAETMSAILRDEPALGSGYDAVPTPALARIITHCLEKRPADRFQSSRDLAFALQSLSTSPGGAAPTALATPYARPLRLLPWIVAALGVVAAATIALWQPAPSVATPPVRRVVLALPEGEPLALAELVPLSIGRTAFAIAPDASRIVYVADRHGTPHLVVRELDRYEYRPIAGTDGAYAPSFSPDGRSIVFLTDKALKRVSLAGGDPLTLAEVRHGTAAVWTDRDWIVFADFEGTNITRVRPDGGNPEIVLRAPKPEFTALSAIEGSDALLAQAMISPNPDAAVIEVLTLDGKSRRPLIRGGSHPLHAGGYVFFLRAGSLHAQRLKSPSLELEGSAVPMLDGIRTETDGIGQIAIAREGALLYLTGPLDWLGTPTWIGPDGSQQPLGVPRQTYGTFRVSPDGKRIAFAIAAHMEDVWVYEIARRTFVRLTQDGGNGLPTWSGDGQRIAYMKVRDGLATVAWKPADGSGPEEVITSDDCAPWSFAPDGTVAMTCAADIRMLAPGGDRRPRPFVTSPYGEWGARFSPDGKWVAYVSDMSGRYEIYVRQYPGGGRQWQISSDGGEEPVWTPDGTQIVYRNGRRLMMARFRTGPDGDVEPPRILFEGSFVNVPGFSYDVAPDGRLLLLKSDDSGPVRQLNLVLNWTEELKQRVPTR